MILKSKATSNDQWYKKRNKIEDTYLLLNDLDFFHWQLIKLKLVILVGAIRIFDLG